MEIALILLWAATLVTVILLLLERLDNRFGAGAAVFAFLDLHWHGLGFFMTLPHLSKTRRWWQASHCYISARTAWE